jgi:hypothetical protein
VTANQGSINRDRLVFGEAPERRSCPNKADSPADRLLFFPVIKIEPSIKAALVKEPVIEGLPSPPMTVKSKRN